MRPVGSWVLQSNNVVAAGLALALDLLVFDPENEDAKNFLAAAQRALDVEV